MNLLECYMPVFILISSIRAEPEKYSSYEITRECIFDNIERVVIDSERIKLSDSDADAAFYAIVVMIDETILCSELPFRKKWRDNLLQVKYFGHSTGGVEFFNLLNKVIEVQSQSGWVFLFCLLLGFRGKYSVSNTNEISNYIASLRKQCNPDIVEVFQINSGHSKNKKFVLNSILSITSISVVYFILLLFLYIK